MSYIYKHIRIDKNEVFYIGIGSDSEYSRAYSKIGRNKYWQNITKSTEYKVEIISETWLTWEEACEKEKFWIKFYGRIDLGTGTLVNMTDGGEGQINPSLYTREKMSLSRKKRKTKDCTKEKIRESRLGKKRINMNTDSIILWNKSQKCRLANKIRMTGENNPNFGKLAKNRKMVLNTTTGQIYNSKKEAAKINEMSVTKLTRLIEQSIKFKYINHYE